MRKLTAFIAVMHDGTVIRGEVLSIPQQHEANFVVIEDAGTFKVWKDRLGKMEDITLHQAERRAQLFAQWCTSGGDAQLALARQLLAEGGFAPIN